MSDDRRVVIVGGGAAGLMAAIFAGRAGAQVTIVDGARRLGAKILISGGGRCNVTHEVVTEHDFNGASRNAIARVLRSFSVTETIEFFESIGVRLKREETGKLFPVSDRAATVLQALVDAAKREDVKIRESWRVDAIRRDDEGFVVIRTTGEELRCDRIVLATGGRSVPKTGSDGWGYELAAAFGHSTTETFPALVPLLTPPHFWGIALSGSTVDATLAVTTSTGAVRARVSGSVLFTHFGLSGPGALDISRHFIAATRAGERPVLRMNMVTAFDPGTLDAHFLAAASANPRATVLSVMREFLPERVVRTVLESVSVASDALLSQLPRARRQAAARAFTDVEIPLTGDRGFAYAEVTAGGVPLTEVELSTMRSRFEPGLFLCGEILDVDGRIGGFNFQWAWASGRLAGLAAGE